MSAKILLARKLRNETHAHSILVGDTGFYWRDLPAEAELLAELRGERFSLIIVDHRDMADDPLAFVESLRRWQKDTPVLVVSEELALENVIRAIRVGVKDLFHHPIDLRAMVERIYTTLKPELGASRSARLDEWSELMMQLTDENARPPVHGSRSGFPGTAAPMTSLPSPGESDKLAQELKTARETMNQFKARSTELEREVTRLKTTPPMVVESKKSAATAQLEAELAAEREKIESESMLLAQQKKKFEAECAARKTAETKSSTGLAELTKREAELEAKSRGVTAAHEKLQVELMQLEEAKNAIEAGRTEVAQIRAIQKETEAKIKQLVIEQVALTKAKERHERDCHSFQTVRAKAEAELARREQAMAEFQAESEHLAAEQIKFEAAQAAHAQATAKLEQDRAAWQAKTAGHDEAMAKMAAQEKELKETKRALAAKELALAEGQEKLAADQERWETDRLVALQVQAKFVKDRAALDKITAAQQEEAERLKAQHAAFAAEQRKAADELAGREEQVALKEKELAPKRAELAAAREKVDADLALAKQNVAKAAAARNEAEAMREELQQQTKSLADKEAELQEAEVLVKNQTAQNLKLQSQIEKDRAASAADKKALEQETAALAERVWLFESKQKQIKEQMKQLLAAG